MRVVRQSRSRRTGTLVLLIDNRDGSFEDGEPDYRWATMCDDHGNYVLHATKEIATSFLPVPDEFCHDCADEDG